MPSLTPGMPKFFYFAADWKDGTAPVAYEGEPTKDGLLRFVAAKPPRTSADGYLQKYDALPWERLEKLISILDTVLGARGADDELMCKYKRGQNQLKKLHRAGCTWRASSTGT